MKMRYKIIIILAAVLTGTFGMAQDHGVRVLNPVAEVSGTMVEVSMQIEADRLDIGCNGSYRLVPCIEKDGVRVQLPEVVYAGSQRYRFDRRREFLSRQTPDPVYKVFPKAHRRKPETLDYRVSIPYMPWMDGAGLRCSWLIYSCRGEESFAVVADGAVTIDGPGLYRGPDPSFYGDVVYYTPEAEQYSDPYTGRMISGKRRSISADLYVNFPRDVPELLPDYMDNAAELRKADSLMNYIAGNRLISVSGLYITGYASPEGALWRNTNLARYRANNLKKYISDRYDTSGLQLFVASVPVNWQGLKEALLTGRYPYADAILQIISDVDGDEQRERAIMDIAGGVPHRRLLNEVYPTLRRTELKAEFTVPGLTAEQARELIYTNPELLSLEEMYMVSGEYEPGSDEYVEVFSIAARQFPDDFIANNNAAAAWLQKGNAAEAYRYVSRIAHDPRAYSNVGTYYYLLGDREEAKRYFRMAVREGIPGADRRLKMIE